MAKGDERLYTIQQRRTRDEETEQQRFGPHLDEREQQIQDDDEWYVHDRVVREKHGGKVVVVHRRKIWGVGKKHATAWAAARRKRGCPSKDQVALVVVPYAFST
jgi:hypothetical protein